MKIAIYSRKSKMTERGESIQNQIEMCKNYAFMNFNASENDLMIYEDEGFSGGTIDRPEFTRLMADIDKGIFNVIICYRLDRVSRNVLHFSNVLELLNKHQVSFVSITEHFDTSTPMGRAMMNIAAVFAQLERETITERIKDNMHRLKLTGRYLGSTPPTGFVSELIECSDANGVKKQAHKLEQVPNQVEFVKLLFDKYLEFRSLAKVETWLMQNKYRNKNDKYIGISEIRRMLTNPVYVQADKSVYDYYVHLGTKIASHRNDFNGANGMLIYGRHDRNKGYSDTKKWMVVMAKHEGFISSAKWLTTQNIIEENKTKAPRSGTSKNALFTSKIKCSQCGATMVVVYGNNPEIHYYKCKTKIKSRKSLCDIKNIQGVSADKELYDYLYELVGSKDKILALIESQNKTANSNNKNIKNDVEVKKAIHEKEIQIKNLTSSLRENQSSVAAKYIITDIEMLDNELSELRKSLITIEEQKSNVIYLETRKEKLVTQIYMMGQTLGTADFERKRNLVDKIVDKVLWDGSKFSIFFSLI